MTILILDTRLSFVLLLTIFQAVADSVIIHVTSTSKEYWVPKVTTTVELPSKETIHSLLGQLCFVFHRSFEMARYKENYPCETKADKLLLYEREKNRRLYSISKEGRLIGLDHYNVKNDTEFMLHYL